ncbi:MAG TPA: acyltransferase family protein [Aeromicrobium sp.]|nr:acyltransferase family protein [Aeromicrobium sp.]
MIALLVGLRGLSAVLIVLSELAGAGIMPAEFGSGLDQIGLMIFVVTSGFVHAIRYAHDESHRFALADYVKARALHVLPLYYLAIVASLAVSGWWDEWPYRFESVTEVVRALALVEAPGQLWIVPVYLQCCVVFLAAWWMWSRGWSVWSLAVLAGVSTIPAFLGWYPESGHALSVVLPYFLVGVGLGLAWPHSLEPFAVRHLGAVSVLGGLSFIVVCINMPAIRAARGWTFGETVVASTWLDPFSAIAVIALVFATAARPIALAVLGAAPLLVLGQFWYTVYLVTPVLVALLPH